jgi:hypothetical protein
VNLQALAELPLVPHHPRSIPGDPRHIECPVEVAHATSALPPPATVNGPLNGAMLALAPADGACPDVLGVSMRAAPTLLDCPCAPRMSASHVTRPDFYQRSASPVRSAARSR